MNQLLSFLLKGYEQTDAELMLKARFLMMTLGVVVIVLAMALVYTSYVFGVNSLTVKTLFVGLAVMFSALILLIRHLYTPAVHLVLTTGFALVWILMFKEPASSMLIKLDTIVFIVGFMSVMPLLFFKTRRPMVIYFVLNCSIFIGFNYHLFKAELLPIREQVDYALDNIIAMGFVFLVSFALLTIHRKILGSLKEMRGILSGMINAMPSVMIGIDNHHEIIMWNQEAEKVFTLSFADVSGKRLLDVLPGLTAFKTNIQTAMTDRVISKAHKKRLNVQGETLTIDIAVYPMSQDEVSGAAIRIDNISDRLRMDELIVQSEKMVSIGGLAEGMAHELNNPLAGMIQSAQVIDNRLTQDFPANEKAADKAGTSMTAIQAYIKDRGIENQLKNIADAGKHASKIVGNMMGFARRSISAKKEFDLIQLIEETISLVLNDYHLKQKYDLDRISIEKKFDSHTASLLPLEPKGLEQALFNLLRNAVEAVGGKQYIDDLPSICLHLYEDTEMVYLSIEDNGSGMDDKVRKRIFDPFYTTKPVDAGTGLGLYVSYFIVAERHGGTIGVESVLGTGTTFTVGLPKTADPASNPAVENTLPQDG